MGLLILLFGWIGYKAAVTHNSLEGKAEPLIRQVLNDQSPWDFETLEPYLSRLWLETVSLEDNQKLLRLYSKLGSIRSVGDINWLRCSTHTTTQFGNIDRCDYLALAKYENGDAHVSVGIVLEEDEPKIIQLHINSDAFFE